MGYEGIFNILWIINTIYETSNIYIYVCSKVSMIY